jgi:hypothetical protein
VAEGIGALLGLALRERGMTGNKSDSVCILCW